MDSADSQLVRELYRKSSRLRQFKASLDNSLQAMLDGCEWSVAANAGKDGLPLMSLRLKHRISLHDPQLIELAEQAERYYGPIDFALFSGETSAPLRVLSKTLIETHWRRKNS